MTKTKKKRRWILPVLILSAVLVVIGAAVILPAMSAPPLEYTAQIQRYSSEFGLDPYMVSAVIDVESGFDPDAVSHAGACGLMQIMPETGEWIAGKLGVDNFRKDMLFDPDTNIQFGCWYLRFLSDRFSGSPDLIAAAYNAGHNRVSDWLEDETISEQGELKNIPYAETSQYVKKIADAIKKYEDHYPDAFGPHQAL